MASSEAVMGNERPTDFANRLGAGNAAIGYDAVCRDVLAEKRILAHILRQCVEEYAGCSVEDIAGKYIEGEPEIGTAPVARGMSSMILGSDTVDKTPGETPIRYDIRFRSMLPGSDERIGLLVNVEAQARFRAGYPLHARAAYYCARLLSSELGSILDRAEYGKLRRVYSIWVCRTSPDGYDNSINEYRMTELPIEGRPYGRDAGHDLMRIVMLNLGDPEAAQGVLRMLDVLFARGKTFSLARKKEVLETEFSIPMTETFERSVTDMCNFSELIREEGMMEGREKGLMEGREKGLMEGREEGRLENSVRLVGNLMRSMNCLPERAMDLLGIQGRDRPALRKALGSQAVTGR